MPYIHISVSRALEESKKGQIKTEIGRLITIIPGKSEDVTMVHIEGGCTLYKGGQALKNGAFVDIRLLGEAPEQSKADLTKAFFQSFEKLLGITADDMYTNITEMPSWGYRGNMV